MADKWCDHGAYGAYAAVPTWGQAQDGDGTAKAVGTPATASVVFTGVPSSGVIAVLGQTITFTSATSADVCANNLATAINASTAVATGPASFTTLSQVRNHLYARGPATGAPAGTCQIMTRQASADHAGLICATHTLNNVSSPATINFAGGSGGCLGYLFNTSSLWPSNVAGHLYGLLSPAAPYTANVNAGDVFNIRSGKTISDGTVTNVSAASLANGTREEPIQLIVDDGTVWPEDGFEPKITHTWNSFGATRGFLTDNTGNFNFLAKKYSDTSYGYNIEHTSGGATYHVYVEVRTSRIIEGVLIYSDRGVYISTGNPAALIGAFDQSHLQKCRFGCPTDVPFINSPTSTSDRLNLTVDDVIVDNAGAGVPHSGIFRSATFGSGANVIFRNVRFLNFIGGSKLFQFTALEYRTAFRAFFFDVDWGGISDYYGNTLTLAASELYTACSSNQFGARDFFMDTGRGFVEWNSLRDFPAASARLLDGVTPWSLRMLTYAPSGVLSRFRFLESPRLSKINSLPTAPRTFKVNFAIPESVSWDTSDVSLVVYYKDDTGVIRTIDSFDRNGGALGASSVTWSNESAGQVTFSDGLLQYMDKKSISVTTPTNVMTGTEIACYFRCHTNVPDNKKSVFVDPEIEVS